MRITVPAPAKINLWLRIGARQTSGFHDLDTLFCALDLADTVTVRTGEVGTGVRLEAQFAPPLDALPALGPHSENLAVRAAVAFQQRARLPPDLHIHLVKRIPVGGGLGGGSSDAGAVLRGLGRLHPGALGQAAIQDMAATLGSDVPFFAAGQPLARGLGRGVDLLTAPVPPARPVLLVLPPLSILTPEAYRWLDEARETGAGPPPSIPRARPLPEALPWRILQDRAFNDFEPVIFARYPALRALRDLMLRHGARPALLAGSGSTLFGVFEHEDAARRAGDAVRGNDPAARVLVSRTRSR